MKKLLALLLFCGVCHAENIAYTGNNSGGYIVLTDSVCAKDKAMKFAFSTSSSGSTRSACWTADNLFVHIVWWDGDVRSYPINIFSLVKKGTES